jgi:hypothetical protein
MAARRKGGTDVDYGENYQDAPGAGEEEGFETFSAAADEVTMHTPRSMEYLDRTAGAESTWTRGTG